MQNNPNPHNTRGHSLKLTKVIYTSNSLANSLVNRCVNCWDALPSSTVLSLTLSQFKTLINKFDFLPFAWVNVRVFPGLSIHSIVFLFALFSCVMS